jgi:cytidine deaminase
VPTPITPSPISGPGNLYLGANMEFPNEALSLCVHGEQSAVNHALIQGETGLQSQESQFLCLIS